MIEIARQLDRGVVFCPRMWRNSCTFPQQYAGAVIVCTPNCWRVVTHKQQQLISNHSNSSSNNTYSCNQAVIITTVLSRFIIIFQSPLKQWLHPMNIVFSMSMASMQDFFPSIHIDILYLHFSDFGFHSGWSKAFTFDIVDNNVSPSWQLCILWLDRGVEVYSCRGQGKIDCPWRGYEAIESIWTHFSKI